MDDTNATVKYHVYPVSRVAKYPTDDTYQAAVASMLAYVGPQIRATGKLAIPNMGAWGEYPGVVKEWLRFVSGGMDQQFVKWSPIPGKGYAGYPRWRTQLREVQTTEKMGKLFLAVTHARPSDRRAVRYGWGTVLLGADGHTAFFAASPRPGDTWSQMYEVPLGGPTSRATPSPNGAWWRTFARGLVIVNPTTSTIPVRFHGAYNGAGPKHSRGTWMRPHTALILTRKKR
jgi:hypothetical protein